MTTATVKVEVVVVTGTTSLKKLPTGTAMPAAVLGTPTLNQLVKPGVTRKHLSPATKPGEPTLILALVVAAGEFQKQFYIYVTLFVKI